MSMNAINRFENATANVGAICGKANDSEIKLVEKAWSGYNTEGSLENSFEFKRRHSSEVKDGDLDSGYRSRERSPLPVPANYDVATAATSPSSYDANKRPEGSGIYREEVMTSDCDDCDVIVKPKSAYGKTPFEIQEERAIPRETESNDKIKEPEDMCVISPRKPGRELMLTEFSEKSMFMQACDTTDMRLIVEGKPLYVSRILICIISPVLRRMIETRSRDQTIVEIPLIDYKYEDIVEFLYCVYPDQLRSITDKNAMKMLSLSEAFKVDSLKRRCETYFLNDLTQHGTSVSPEKVVVFLRLAEKYELEEVRKTCLKLATRMPSDLLENVEEFFELSHLTTSSIFLTRLRLFEEASRAICKKYREAETHCALYHKSERWSDTLCNRCLAGVGKVASAEISNLSS